MRTVIMRGRVVNGVVVPENGEALPEGAHVEIHILDAFGALVVTSGREEGEDDWRRQSEESWATIAWGQG